MKYPNIVEAIRASITDGTYPPGTKLPTMEQLALTHDVATMTVQNAIRVLRHEGLVRSRPGVGMYVTEREPGASGLTDREILDEAQGILSGSETTVIELVDQAGTTFRRIAVDQTGRLRLEIRGHDNVIVLRGVTAVNDREKR